MGLFWYISGMSLRAANVRSQQKKIWFTYLLRCGDGSFYIGITNDLEKRLRTHAAGKGGAYTRSHLPVELVWKKKERTATDARKREAAMKKWSRAKKHQLIG